MNSMEHLPCLGALMIGAVLFTAANSDAQQVKSDSKVKAGVARARSGDEQKHVLNVTLDIDQGWFLFANPVNCHFLEDASTKIKLTSNGKAIGARVKYPAGTERKDGKELFNVYQGRIVIPVEYNKADGALGVTVHIAVHANAHSMYCLRPAVIKLNIPGDLK